MGLNKSTSIADTPELSGSIPRASATATRVLLQRLYEPVQKELVQVERLYRKELSSDDPYISNLLEYIEDYSGKRLRPALLLLAGRACGELTDDHIRLGVVAEMLHTATLVHDDILDDALLRRKRTSINALAGNEVSVLLGDHIFTHAFEISLECSDPVGAREFARAISHTCFGEITQIHNRNNFDLTEEQYLGIIEGKTADLYATSAMLGAHYAGASEEISRAFFDYGLNLGRAFQIMDDLLDLLGEESLVGKTLGSDVEKGKPTLPLIHHLDLADEAGRARALQAARRAGAGREDLVGLLRSSGSFDYAAGRAREYVDAARRQLELLGENDLRPLLEEIAEFVISRDL